MPGTSLPPDLLKELRDLKQRVADLERKITQRTDLAAAPSPGHTHMGYPSHIQMVKDPTAANLTGTRGSLDLSGPDGAAVHLVTSDGGFCDISMGYGANQGEMEIFATNALHLNVNRGSSGVISFFEAIGDTTPAGAAIQTVTGSRGGNAALASLLTALAAYNLVVDSST